MIQNILTTGKVMSSLLYFSTNRTYSTSQAQTHTKHNIRDTNKTNYNTKINPHKNDRAPPTGQTSQNLKSTTTLVKATPRQPYATNYEQLQASLHTHSNQNIMELPLIDLTNLPEAPTRQATLNCNPDNDPLWITIGTGVTILCPAPQQNNN
jgi:hypothetical protein